MTQPILIVLCGLPATGKSTIRDELYVLDTVVLSTDDVVSEIATNYRVEESRAVFGDLIEFSKRVINQRARECVSFRKGAIWDQTNMSRKKRQGILSRFSGYKKICVEVVCDEVVRKKRQTERGRDIPDYAIQSMINRYETPTVEEGFNKVVRIDTTKGVVSGWVWSQVYDDEDLAA